MKYLFGTKKSDEKRNKRDAIPAKPPPSSLLPPCSLPRPSLLPRPPSSLQPRPSSLFPLHLHLHTLHILTIPCPSQPSPLHPPSLLHQILRWSSCMDLGSIGAWRCQPSVVTWSAPQTQNHTRMSPTLPPFFSFLRISNCDLGATARPPRPPRAPRPRAQPDVQQLAERWGWG